MKSKIYDDPRQGKPGSKNFFYFLIFVFCFSNLSISKAQCSLYPLPLTTIIGNSSVIAEGKVIAKRSFWNPQHTYIYTSNLVVLSNSLKGSISSLSIEVITEGGEIDLQKQIVDPSLQLNPGDEGLFALNSSESISQFGFPVYQTYADQQGFIKYNSKEGSAHAPFTNYTSITNDLYPKLQNLLAIVIPPYQSSGKGYSSSSISSISGMSPLTITAGTFSVLTITGTGFGSTQGSSIVEFNNADDGGATFIQPDPSQYVSWNSTQIQVIVPTRASTVSGTAGTGLVRVTVGGSSTLSAQTLTVDYGELNVYYSTNSQVYNTRHVDLNGNSGISWQMYTSFNSNSTAKLSFLRALQSWRCNTYINWTLGAITTTNSIGFDGVNVVRFDIGTELPVGVLGRCTSYFSGCSTGTVINWFVSELDICFDDPATSSITWQFGPSAATGSQYDFESVALHELGHGHQLSHVINSNDAMHYALANAQNKRTLISQNLAGGNDVMSRNISPGVCTYSAMVAITPSICSTSVPTASFTLPNSVCEGQSLALNDLSSDLPSSWSWTITGGSPSSATLQNTSTVFSTAGIYSISLMATNVWGSSSVLTKTINVQALPVLSVSNATICSGTSTLLTATGATNYTWNPGALTGASQNLNPASTTIYTITGDNGCLANLNSTLTVVNLPTITVSNATICSGSPTLITVGGASSYTWSPGNLNGASQNLNPAANTIYTVSGSGALCSSSSTLSIQVLANPTITVPNADLCSGNSTLLTASGASSYTWSPGNLNGASQNLSPLSTTIYTITGSLLGCSQSTTALINVTATPIVSVGSGSICSGNSFSLTASGAISYTWIPGSLTGASQNLSPTVTTIYTVTGANGTCTNNANGTLSVTTTPTLSVANASICSGTSTPLTANGANTYTWNPGTLSGASQNFNPLINSTYTITGSIGSCTSSTSASINVTSTPTLALSNGTLCAGSSIIKTVNGASGYTWNPGVLTGGSQTLSPASTTIYTITGNNGMCLKSNTLSITVYSLSPLFAIVAPANICAGNTATLVAGGAMSYTWTNAVPGFSVTGPDPIVSPSLTTTYTVAASDGTCINTTTVFLQVSANPNLTISASSPSICSGSTFTLSASGANSYTWSPLLLSSITITTSLFASENYTLFGTSLNGCSSSTVITLSVTPVPTLSINAAKASLCEGENTTLSASGANSYLWSQGAATSTSIVVSPSLPGASYTLTGANGVCVATLNITIPVTPNPTITLTGLPASICPGSYVNAQSFGADSYTWQPINNLSDAAALMPSVTTIYTITGQYTATGCSASTINTLTVLPGPGLTISASTLVLCESSSATLTATANSAATYTWANTNSTLNTLVVTPGSTTEYTLAGTLGTCYSETVIQITVNPRPTVVTTASVYICSGSPLGLTASGGGTYTWMPVGLTGSQVVVTPSANTLYTVTTSDSNGCRDSTLAYVGVSPTPTITLTASETTICLGNSVSLFATGSSILSWSGGLSTGSTNIASPVATTIYTVTGYNMSLCNGSATLQIVVNLVPTLSTSSPQTSVCAGGQVTLNVSGAQTYSWTTVNSTSSVIIISPAYSSVYSAVGTNSLGCSSILNMQVSVIPLPITLVSFSPAIACAGTSYTISVSGTGTYSWSPAPGSTTSNTVVVTPAATTSYTVSGVNSICSTYTSITIPVNPKPTLSFSSLPLTLCSGNTATLTSGGADVYNWAPGNLSGNSVTLSPAATTIYTITGTFTNTGCSSTSNTTLTVISSPSINVTSSQTLICANTTATLMANGSNSYTWNPGNLIGSTQTVTPLGNLTFTVDGSNGLCGTTSSIITLSVNPQPTITVDYNSLICLGESALITPSGATNYTYEPGNFTGTSLLVNPSTSTTYSITGESQGCSSNVETVLVNVSLCEGIALNSSESAFHLYPNPATDKITLLFGSSFTGKLVVVNALGQLLTEKDLSDIRQLDLALDLYPKGVYFLKIMNGKHKTTTTKLIKN